MKYVVIKDFLDRFDNRRHCKPGELHVPPNEERAQHLIELGFIAPIVEPKSEAGVTAPDTSDVDSGSVDTDEWPKSAGGGYWDLPNGQRIRGKEKALKVLAELNAGEGEDPDGGQTDESSEV